jgi:hypothetical protein
MSLKGRGVWLACAALAATTLLFLVGLDPWRTLESTFFFVFQARDLERARELAGGNLIFFGPEMTGGGNLPGPLYYLLLSLPLAAGFGWKGAWGLMLALASAGGAAGWFWLRRRVSAPAAWFWLTLFSGAFFTRVLLEMFMNISFTLFFAVGAVAAICESCAAETRERRARAAVAACFLLGLGVQLHLSLIFFLLAFFWLRPVKGKALAASLFAFALPLLPYAGWIIAGSAGAFIGQSPGLVGRSRDALPTIVSYAGNLFRVSPLETLSHAGRFLEVLPMPLILLGLLLLRMKPAAAGESRHQQLLRALLVCIAFGLLPFAYFFVAPIGRRYVVPLGVPVLFLAALAFERARQHPAALRAFHILSAAMLGAMIAALALGREMAQPNWRIFAQAAVAAAAFGVAALFFSRVRPGAAKGTALAVALAAALCTGQRALLERGYTNTSHVSGLRYVPSAGEWRAIWTIIRSRTCWTYEEARQRVFYVNHHLEQEPSFSFGLPGEPIAGCHEGGKRPATPDGFIVSIQKRDESDPLAWLLAQNLQGDLKRGLASGAIELMGPSLSPGFLVVPYRVNDPASYPTRFHNAGAGYLARGQHAFPGPATRPEEASRLPDGRLLFRWNECEGFSLFCDTGAYVRLEATARNEWKAEVNVVGAAISQTSPWISPNWTESWRRPYVEIECAGHAERVVLADSIGYEQGHGHAPGFPFDYNNSIVAPFYREARFHCAGGPHSVTVGREATAVETLREMRLLPVRRLTLPLR